MHWTSALLHGSCSSGVFVLLVEMPKAWADNSWGSEMKGGSKVAKLAAAKHSFNTTWCHHPALRAQPPFYCAFQDLPLSSTTWAINNNSPGPDSEVFRFQCLHLGCLWQILVLSQRAPKESYWKSNYPKGFSFPAVTRSDIKGKRDVSTALGECWGSPWAPPHPPLLFREDLSKGGEGFCNSRLQKRLPTNVFVLHNNAVNRSVSLYKTSHSPWHRLFPASSCCYSCVSLLIAHPPLLGSQGGKKLLLPGAAGRCCTRDFKPPSSHLSPPPHATFSFYFWEAGISQHKETAAVLGEKSPVTP